MDETLTQIPSQDAGNPEEQGANEGALEEQVAIFDSLLDTYLNGNDLARAVTNTADGFLQRHGADLSPELVDKLVTKKLEVIRRLSQDEGGSKQP